MNDITDASCGNVKQAVNVVVAVGNSMMADDGAGPLLAEMMAAKPVDSWTVIDAGTAPENCIHQVRALNPDRVLVVDAAEIGLEAGSIRIIDPESIADMFIMSTHTLPLNFVIDELKTFVPEVLFVGIQPAIVAFSFPMTEMMTAAVETVYKALPDWRGAGGFEAV
ncbi:hydrogenase maturation peptidase HycI [Endozoicomonas sp. Mp262]|uniref:hydrogenase maturation peptidase HycI n=1 Tax=Endozoicomonas sp. Mp262 TaxID=2919499 RepID=UPI0021D8161D